MNPRLIRVLALAIILSLAGGHIVFAQKSRSRSAARSRVKKDTRSKRPAVSRKAKQSRKKGRVSSRRRGRAESRSQRRGRPSSQTQEPSSTAPQRLPSGIPTERIIEIQSALSKMGYYEGPPSGQWDEATVEALKQFQAANRLSTTGLPSALTLKKLGVSKTSNDGYSVPVKSVSQNEKNP